MSCPPRSACRCRPSTGWPSELVDSDYLVHIRSESRYELGYKLHRLGLSLHRQVGLSRALDRRDRPAARVDRLRGVPQHPARRGTRDRARRRLAGLPAAASRCASASTRPRTPPPSARSCWPTWPPRNATLYLARHGLRALTANTITERPTLDEQLDAIARRGIAWEREEFLAGWGCAAVPVRGGDSALLGAVAVSAQPAAVRRRRRPADGPVAPGRVAGRGRPARGRRPRSADRLRACRSLR